MSQIHAISADDSPVQCVVSAVAAETDRSPLEIPPIGEAVDPDALNALLSNGSDEIEVTFDYLGYELSVTHSEVRLQASDGE